MFLSLCDFGVRKHHPYIHPAIHPSIHPSIHSLDPLSQSHVSARHGSGFARKKGWRPRGARSRLLQVRQTALYLDFFLSSSMAPPTNTAIPNISEYVSSKRLPLLAILNGRFSKRKVVPHHSHFSPDSRRFCYKLVLAAVGQCSQSVS
jgi:hypothetical protein